VEDKSIKDDIVNDIRLMVLKIKSEIDDGKNNLKTIVADMNRSFKLENLEHFHLLGSPVLENILRVFYILHVHRFKLENELSGCFNLV
jgi:hypothetical protein